MPEVQVGAKKIFYDTYEATLESVDAAGTDLLIMRFRLDKPISFLPGQYVSLSYPGVRPAPFSIASSPEDHEHIELGVEIVGGPVTSRLKEAKIGDRVMMKGAFGNFTLQGEKKVCFLAGGTGVVPFMSMLRWISDTRQDVNATLLYSCRHGEFLWLKELEQLAERPNIQAVFTCTRETPASWQYMQGRIDERIIRQELPGFAEYTFYCCGPRAFIEGMFTTLKSMGVPESQMRREIW